MIRAFTNWLREEIRLARLDNWQDEDMSFRPCSSEDPRCAETIKRLSECRDRMKRMKSGVLDSNRKWTDSASTDVLATIRKAQSVSYGPVRMVQPKRSAR